MNWARSTFARSAASNAAFIAIAAVVFIAFTVLYTRHFGVEQYGQFSLLLNTATALISLGAYEGFLITHSVVQTRAAFDRFNARFAYFNAGLVVVAAVVFSATTGIVSWMVLAAVCSAAYLDYRSQSSMAVLITRDDNWKIRAFRTVYQVVLLVLFSALSYSGVALEYAFAIAVFAASMTNYGLLRQAAVSGLSQDTAPGTTRSEAGFRVLLIAIGSNVATVAFLLLDKVVISWFGVGTPYEVGLYFLFFDLAIRAEALFMLLSVPVTHFLLHREASATPATREITLMLAGCAVVGVIAGILGLFLVPPIYGISLEGLEALPWVFGLYVSARGIRYLIKAVCNAAGFHWTLLVSNVVVLVAGSTGIGLVMLADRVELTVAALAAILALAQLFRLPFLIAVLARRTGLGEHAALGPV